MSAQQHEDFAIAARTRIEARNRERTRRAEKRDRRERIALWLLAPLLLPAAGAAGAIAVLHADGAAGLAVASVVAPALVTVWLARRRGWLELVLWPLITLAAAVALIFWVGLVWLGYGPG
jgi:hypothetical protein